MTRPRKNVGRVSFVGAGPGDPELVTSRALQACRDADVVFVADQVPEAITARLDGDVRVLPISADSAKTILAEARNGLAVARLVAGDPFSAEETMREVLATAKTLVPFEVVPGICAAVGAASYAGIPVGGVRTAAEMLDIDNVDFDALAAAPGSLVLTIPAADVARVGEQLVANGVKPDTPIAVISDATTTKQQTVIGTLGEIDLVATGMSGQVVVTVGKAVGQREKLG